MKLYELDDSGALVDVAPELGLGERVGVLFLFAIDYIVLK